MDDCLVAYHRRQFTPPSDQPIDSWKGQVIDKYDDITPEQLVSMSAEQLSEYYHALYQEAGKLLFMIPQLNPDDKPQSEWYYFPKGEIGWWMHSSLQHSVLGIADALAGLVDYYSEKMVTNADE